MTLTSDRTGHLGNHQRGRTDRERRSCAPHRWQPGCSEPWIWGEDRRVFWAIVTDQAGVANISRVYADVFYPAAGSDPGPDGGLPFEVELLNSFVAPEALVAFDAAYATNLVTMGNSATPNKSGINLANNRPGCRWGNTTLTIVSWQGTTASRLTLSTLQNVHGSLEGVLYWLALTTG